VSELPGDTPEEARVLITSLFWAFRSGASAAEIAEIASRAARHAGDLIALDTYVSPSDFIVVALRWADRLDLAEQVASRALEQARHHGSMPSFARASVHLAAVRRRRGQLSEAEADAAHGDRRNGRPRSAHGDRAARLDPSGQGPGQ
jgi:sRNA-binding protein